MSGALRGERNHQWKGGRSVASTGYVLVRVGIEHHLADVRGYAYEHRLVAEGKIGRRLKRGEVVHHIDGVKTNNAPSNIEILTAAEHRRAHRKLEKNLRIPGEPNPSIACACNCGGTFLKFDKNNRPRRFITGHNTHVRPTKRGA